MSATKNVPAKKIPPENVTTQEAPQKKPIYKRWQLWTAVALVIVLTMTLVLTVDYHLLAAFIRLGCRPKKPKLPENYAEIVASTEAIYDIDYGSERENGFLDIFYPKGVKGEQPTLVYAHGGYYLGGDKAAVEHYCRSIAASGFVVASINYGLAPENKYPAQAKQFNEAVEFLANSDEYHVDKNQLFFGGDSAGAHLAAQMGACYTNDILAQKVGITPAVDGESVLGVILLSGFYDMDTLRSNKFPMANTAMWAFTGKRAYENYVRVSELDVKDNITRDYPAAFVSCGDGDKFLPQANLLIAALTEKNVDCQPYLPENGGKLGHTYAHDLSTKEGSDALAAAVKFMTDRSEFEVGEFDNTEIYATFVFSTSDLLRVRLYPEYAPITVKNFIEYAESGFYDNTAIHRVVGEKVVQGGGMYIDENGNYVDKPTDLPPIYGEFANNGYPENVLHNDLGVLAMARTSEYNSATSQFFFNVRDNSDYDGDYAAFGVCVSENAADILTRLSNVQQNNNRPLDPIILRDVVIEYVKK